MALQLRIISDHRRQLGERSAVVFDRTGGGIGRSADNDWVLPDPLRYISAHHARILFRDGRYFVEDLSTNGVFINDLRPARGDPQPLQNGDVLRLGEYQIVAMLDASPADAAAAVTSDPDPLLIQVQRVSVAAPPTPGAAVEPPAAARTHEASPPDELLDDEAEAAERMARLARAVTRAEERRTANRSPAEARAGLAAFCRGAGIDSGRLPGDAAQILQLIGQLVRETLVGLKDLERARSGALAPLGIDPPADDDPRPSLAHSGVEEVLVQVLSQHERRRLDAVLWLRDALDGARDHDRAALGAMQAALAQFIARLDPAELAQRFQRGTRSGADGPLEARYWELFGDFYRNLTETRGGSVPHAFADAFATAYREALARRRG